MNLRSLLILLVCAFWVATEMALVIRRRAGAAATRRDSGSLALLNAVIYGAVALGMYLGPSGRSGAPLPGWLLWLGLVLIVAGLAYRWWAILTLRQFFTVDVAIHADHRLVQAGPYRRVRHPAYTGCLLSFAGLALCSGSWLSALLVFVPIAGAFLYRMNVEERALREAFPQAYPEYAARTARLVPWLY